VVSDILGIVSHNFVEIDHMKLSIGMTPSCRNRSMIGPTSVKADGGL